MIAVLAYYSLILVKNDPLKYVTKCLESYHKSLIREPYILFSHHFAKNRLAFGARKGKKFIAGCQFNVR